MQSELKVQADEQRFFGLLCLKKGKQKRELMHSSLIYHEIAPRNVCIFDQARFNFTLDAIYLV